MIWLTLSRRRIYALAKTRIGTCDAHMHDAELYELSAINSLEGLNSSHTSEGMQGELE